MACNCWGRKSSPPRVAPPTPRATPAKPAQPHPPPVMPQPSAVSSDTKFCKRCGWMIKKVRYVDPRTNVTIEKFICPNQSCKNYSV